MMRSSSYHLLLIIALSLNLILLSDEVSAKEKQIWPAISPLHAVFSISTDQPHVETIIFSKEGRGLYVLRCHPGDYMDEFDSDYDHMYHCKMLPTDLKDEMFDLFKPSKKWNRARTRALFRREQVNGGCKTHRYYGAKRIFLMRNMEVTLEVTKFSSPSVTDMLNGKRKPYFSFQLIVDIKPSPEAVLPHAAPVPEICEGSYELNKKGVAVETIDIDKDPAWGLDNKK